MYHPGYWPRPSFFLGLLALLLVFPVEWTRVSAATAAATDTPLPVLNRAPDLLRMAAGEGSAWTLQDVEMEGLGRVDLILTQVEVFAPNARITVNAGQPNESRHSPPDVRFLRGEIAGWPGSVVALTQERDGTLEGWMTDSDSTWRLFRRTLEAPLEGQSIEPEAAVRDKPFACGNEALSDLDPAQTAVSEPPPHAELPAGQFYQATVAIETDHEFYALFGSESAATQYIGSLYNYVGAIYEAEIQTRLLVGDTFLWSSPADPWVEIDNTTCRLYEFGRYWRDHRSGVTRTLAHFLSGLPLYSGVAWMDALCLDPVTYTQATGCASVGNDLVAGDFGVSTSLSGTFSTPAGPTWDAIVVAHEMGHNFSSPHTHCYANLGGHSSPVDACWNTQSGCWSGAVSLPGVDSLTGGTAGARNGTIMSYCHQLTGGLGNLATTFGLGHPYGVGAQRVADQMFNRTAAVAAANSSCLPIVSTSTYTVTATAGPNGSISPASQTVTHGATATLTVTPNTGYSASATGCGGSLDGTTYTTGPITADCTVSASFSAITHTVTATAGPNGSISPASQTVTHGATATLTLTPDAGYTASATGCGGTLTGTTYTTGPITADCTVSATFTLQSSCTLDVDGNGQADALTDGLLTIRYLFGFRGATLIDGAVDAGCTRCTAPEIEAYLDSLNP